MDGENPVKTQNLEIRNLEMRDAPQELAEEDARQVVGGLTLTLNNTMVSGYCAKKDDPSLLLDR